MSVSLRNVEMVAARSPERCLGRPFCTITLATK
jgi:hypothetical protein